MELFVEKVNGFQLLLIFVKSSILEVQLFCTSLWKCELLSQEASSYMFDWVLDTSLTQSIIFVLVKL